MFAILVVAVNQIACYPWHYFKIHLRSRNHCWETMFLYCIMKEMGLTTPRMDISIPCLEKFNNLSLGMMSFETLQGFAIPILKIWANLQTRQRSIYELTGLFICASWSVHLLFACMGIKLVLSSCACKILSMIQSTSKRCFRRVWSRGSMGIYSLGVLLLSGTCR